MLLQSLSAEALPQILLFGAMFIVMYFFLIRPQQKKAKDQKTFIESLAREMKVVTSGGLHGKIIDVSENTVTVEIDKGVRIKMDKTAIAYQTEAVTKKTT